MSAPQGCVLLLDHNLSFRTARALTGVFEAVHHVYDFGMDETPDEEILRFAAARDWIIVTKDSDFLELVETHGTPPKIVLLLVGNQPNKVIEATLLSYRDAIHALRRDETDCLQIRFPVSP